MHILCARLTNDQKYCKPRTVGPYFWWSVDAKQFTRRAYKVFSLPDLLFDVIHVRLRLLCMSDGAQVFCMIYFVKRRTGTHTENHHNKPLLPKVGRIKNTPVHAYTCTCTPGSFSADSEVYSSLVEWFRVFSEGASRHSTLHPRVSRPGQADFLIFPQVGSFLLLTFLDWGCEPQL